MNAIQPHPLSDIFPRMLDADFDALAESIKDHGLQHKIIIFEGKILDGRHRYRACLKVGVKPLLEVYRGNDPIGLVISANLHRRHLDQSQRAMIAARIADIKQKDTRTTANLQSGKAKPDGHETMTHEQAAEVLNVSTRLVASASKILDEAPKSIVKQVDAGEMSLHAAEQAIKELDRKQQKKTEVHLDSVNYEIPSDLVPVWERRGEVLDMMKRIAAMETQLKQSQESKDAVFSAVHYSDVISHLQFAHAELRAAQIYAVCTTCQGRVRKSCAHCKGRGFLSKSQWDLLPSEIKALRGKS